MNKRILLHSFLIISSLLFNFSIFGANEETKEILCSDDPCLIKADQSHIDGAIIEILQILDANQGRIGHLPAVGSLLERLVTAHEFALGSSARNEEIDAIKEAAQAALIIDEPSCEDGIAHNPNALQEYIESLKLLEPIKQFLIGYLITHSKNYQSITLQAAVAVGGGFCFGLGGTKATDLSGKIWIGPCLSAGFAGWLGCDIAVERFERENWLSGSHRFHWARFVGFVREIASQRGTWHRKWLHFKKDPLIRGLAVGYGDIDEYSVQVSAAHLPIPCVIDLSFARKRLGIRYPEKAKSD